jgi:hypothetical protein
MLQRTPLRALAVGTLLFASACSDHGEPSAPNSQPETPAPQLNAQGTADDPISLGRSVPGFGGFYLDQGTPVVYLKNAAERGNAERALAPFFRSQGIQASQLRILPAKYDWAELERWHGKASSEVLTVAGAVFVDADEAGNRVTIGAERSALAQIRGVVARLGIPDGAVVIQETSPIRFAATLQSRVRPVVGGLQINFPGFLCTLGFNAIRNGQNSFITNSHCTSTQGGTEGTPYWQPTQTAAPARIGTEVNDPTYFKNTNGCPAGKRCRFSDASRAAYASGVTSSLGKIAKTTGPNNNSTTINGSFTITAEGGASVGQTVSKVGRTTGWTRGTVTNTCATVNIKGTNTTQLCQNIVSARVGGGDSGSPVFKGSTSVTLSGILWGGDETGTVFIYSPLANVERELGALRTF